MPKIGKFAISKEYFEGSFSDMVEQMFAVLDFDPVVTWYDTNYDTYLFVGVSPLFEPISENDHCIPLYNINVSFNENREVTSAVPCRETLFDPYRPF